MRQTNQYTAKLGFNELGYNELGYKLITNTRF